MTEFRVPIRPRYGEVDSMGVVYHAHYLVYFDVGRCEYMRALGCPYADVEAAGFRLAVVDADVRYRSPAHYDRELSLVVWLTDVRGASVTFRYELRDGTRVLATGSTRLACLDEQNRPTRLPRDLHRTLLAGRNAHPTASEAP